MIDPFTLAQTHPSLETHYPVQTHTMLEKTPIRPMLAQLIKSVIDSCRLRLER